MTRPRLFQLGPEARLLISALAWPINAPDCGAQTLNWRPPADTTIHARLQELEDGPPGRLLRAGMSAETRDAIDSATAVLGAGGLAGIPTETVYGLAADARSPSAMERVFIAKSRPSDNPLIVHVSSLRMLRNLLGAEEGTRPWPAAYDKLMACFWPGPLTLVFERPQPSASSNGTSTSLIKKTISQLQTVAVRMPAHAGALALIENCGFPLAAPSANLSGRPSPTDAVHVVDELNGELVPLVLDGGPCGEGLESTVIATQAENLCTMLRPGPISSEIVGRLLHDSALSVLPTGHKVSTSEAPLAPGMKYRHYAPRAQVIVVEPNGSTPSSSASYEEYIDERQKNVARTVIKLASSNPGATGIIWTSAKATGPQSNPPDAAVKILLQNGKSPFIFSHYCSTPESAGRELFRALRHLDNLPDLHTIVVEGMNEMDGFGVGAAFMNRVRKAASGK